LFKLLRRLLLSLLLAVLVLAGAVWWTDPFHLWGPIPYDVATSPVTLLPPGTVVGDSAPEGWTHLVIKSRPAVSSGAVSRLSEEEIRYATFLFMTTVARVKAQKVSFRTTYVLDDVAIGVGTDVDGKDVVLSLDTQKKLGARLGLIYRLILAGAYRKQEAVRVVARAPAFALVDTPALMLRHGKHVDTVIRYALLVEPHSGRLDTLALLIDRAEKPDEAIGPVEWLAPDMNERPPLHIDDREFLLGQPTERAYAVEGMPPGKRQLDLPDDLQRLAGQKNFTATEAQQLDAGLRRLLRTGTDP
jgi:hypothetical protein